MDTKIQRITHEAVGGEPDDRAQQYINDGWKVHHDVGTAMVSLVHPRGGKISLCEVLTYGGPFTTGEADKVAAMVAAKTFPNN